MRPALKFFFLQVFITLILIDCGMADYQIDRNRNPVAVPDLVNSNSSFTLVDSVSTDIQTERVSSPINTYGFKAGDLVWGKVKSHPWWPGHVFNESFASSSVRRTKSKGLLLVAFFGDSSYGWFDPSELIPYEPYFLEKSKQTNQKTFLKALEESLDETSRRVALGLSCRCRNPMNFMSIRVENHYEVDVVGYDRNGIYSKEQILKERKWFDQKNVLGFLKNVAVWNTQIDNDSKDVNWYRNVAAVVALRQGRFEEFDETYAQAFGEEPVRPTRKKMGVLEEMESFGPRVAPLQGTLLIAENLGNKKKKATAKQLPSTSALPEPSPISKERQKKKKKENKFILKKREQASPPESDLFFNKPNHNETEIDYKLQNSEESIKETKPDPSEPESKPEEAKKIKKRTIDEDNNVKLPKKQKSQVAIEPIHATPPTNSTPPLFLFPSPPPNTDPTQINLQTVLSDITFLAANPFSIIDPDALATVHFALARFRLLVYSKRPFLLENDCQEHEVEEKQKTKPLSELTKPTLKRGPSSPPKSEKKAKVKKAGNSDAPPSTIVIPKPAAVKKPEVEPVKKPKVEPAGVKKPVKKPEKKKEEPKAQAPSRPTYLIMKFPRNVTLPSVANLKARFATFGNIIAESTRVYWKTHTCKVLFKEKRDAVKAYVRCKDGAGFFGGASVNYSIHETEPEPEPIGRSANSGSGGPKAPPADPPKSILKKRGMDEVKVQRVTFADLGDDVGRDKNSPRKSPPPPPPPPLRSQSALHDPRRPFVQATMVRASEAQLEPAAAAQAATVRVVEAQVVPTAGAKEEGEKDVVDGMYDLMIMINTVIGRIRNLPGFIAYGPL